MEGLQDYEAWFTGLRREQSPTRKNLKDRRAPRAAERKKFSSRSGPLAAWTWDQVWNYTLENKIEYLPLYDRGYLSIGCEAGVHGHPCRRCRSPQRALGRRKARMRHPHVFKTSG